MESHADTRELLTERLRLRPVTSGDLELLLALRNEPRVLAGTATGEELPRERMERQLERWLSLWDERGVGTWIAERDGEAVGFVALDPMGEGYEEIGVERDDLEIGVVVHPDSWGAGIAGEAGLAVATDCLARARLGRLYATVDHGNARSLGVLAKAGTARLLRSDADEQVWEIAASVS